MGFGRLSDDRLAEADPPAFAGRVPTGEAVEHTWQVLLGPRHSRDVSTARRATDRLEPNGQVAVLVHELAHVHGARYQEFGQAGAEVVAETAAFVALSAVRLDTGRQSVPYVAGWADAAPKELAAYAEAVHGIAATLERGLGLASEFQDRQAPVRDDGARHALTRSDLARSNRPARGR